MTNYILRRLLILAPVMLGVVTLVFFLLHLVPGDPVDHILGETASVHDKQVLRQQLGLDQPIMAQYGQFLLDLLQADLGQSIHSQQPVLDEILERFPATLELMVGAMIIALLISLPLGLIAAVRSGSVIDFSAMMFALLGISIPHFWLGPMLILIFSIELNWLPVNERGTFLHLILPAFTLGTALAAILSRITRGSVRDVLGADFIRTARAKGLSGLRVVLSHALPNALLPIVTVIGLQVGVLLSGAIITEHIFDWPGLGTLLIEAIQSRNYPLVQGCVIFISLCYMLVNLLTDLTYAFIDPRIRVQ